jgi:hypothetical protein
LDTLTLSLKMLALSLPLSGLWLEWQLSHASLPPTMMTHFGSNGQGSGATPVGDFFAVAAGIFILLWFLFDVGIPALIRLAPPSLVNLPNHDYWLSPERRAEAIPRFERWFAALALMMGLFDVWVVHLVIQANQVGRLANGPFVIGMIVFFALINVWLIGLGWAFALPRS